jgi:hypothetical protein
MCACACVCLLCVRACVRVCGCVGGCVSRCPIGGRSTRERWWWWQRRRSALEIWIRARLSSVDVNAVRLSIQMRVRAPALARCVCSPRALASVCSLARLLDRLNGALGRRRLRSLSWATRAKNVRTMGEDRWSEIPPRRPAGSPSVNSGQTRFSSTCCCCRRGGVAVCCWPRRLVTVVARALARVCACALCAGAGAPEWRNREPCASFPRRQRAA